MRSLLWSIVLGALRLRGPLLLLFFGSALVASLVACAAPEQSDHWRDAVKSDKGLIRGS